MATIKNDEVETLQREIYHLSEQLREADQQRENDRRRREQERKEAAKESQYNAADWPEAFGKQLVRLRDEIRFSEAELAQALAGAYDNHDPKAREWWKVQCDQLRQQVVSIEQLQSAYAEKMQQVEQDYKAARLSALQELAATIPGEEILNAAEHLRADDPSAWLYW